MPPRLSDAARAVAEFSRAVAAGESPQMIILALQRSLQRLHRIRTDLDAGTSFEEAIRQQRPPVHFKLKDAIGLQCRMWTSPRLAQALARTAEAAKAARLNSALEDAIAEELLITVATAARPKVGASLKLTSRGRHTFSHTRSGLSAAARCL